MKDVVKSTDTQIAQVNQLSVAANDTEAMNNRTAQVKGYSSNVSKRIADLKWQINFTQIQLNRWHALENGKWTSLKIMQKTAKLELTSLMLQ